MAGPLQIGTIKDAKVCGLISIVKPGGDRRQVGNLSAPKGSSFNDGIHPYALQEWIVKQTTTKQVAEMIWLSGKDSFLSCSDVVAAYKNLPVSIAQRSTESLEGNLWTYV